MKLVFRKTAVIIVSIALLGLATPSATAVVSGNVPGRFCKSAEIGKKLKTARYGTIECKREGSRARWKRVRS